MSALKQLKQDLKRLDWESDVALLGLERNQVFDPDWEKQAQKSSQSKQKRIKKLEDQLLTNKPETRVKRKKELKIQRNAQSKMNKMMGNRENIKKFITLVKSDKNPTNRTKEYQEVLNKLINRNSNRATTQQYIGMKQSIKKAINNARTKSISKSKPYARTSKSRTITPKSRTITYKSKTKIKNAITKPHIFFKVTQNRANKIASKRASNDRKFIA